MRAEGRRFNLRTPLGLGAGPGHMVRAVGGYGELSRSENEQPRRTRSGGELKIVGRDVELRPAAIAVQQSGRKMERIETTERRRERLRGAGEHRTGKFDDLHAFEQAEDGFAPVRDFVGRERSSQAHPIEGSQTLHLRQRARHRLRDLIQIQRYTARGEHAVWSDEQSVGSYFANFQQQGRTGDSGSECTHARDGGIQTARRFEFDRFKNSPALLVGLQSA